MRETAPNVVDEAILAFCRSWYEYGGGSDEDIYVEFGLPARTYFQRLTALLDGPAGTNIDDATLERMKAVCVARLH